MPAPLEFRSRQIIYEDLDPLLESKIKSRPKSKAAFRDSMESEEELLSRLKHFMSMTLLSYSLLVMYDECIYGLRDPFGNRPLCIGKLVPPRHRGLKQENDCTIEGKCLLLGTFERKIKQRINFKC